MDIVEGFAAVILLVTIMFSWDIRCLKRIAT
jgi:hypothetical protein